MTLIFVIKKIVKDKNEIFVCGYNKSGQLGLGDTRYKNILTKLPFNNLKMVHNLQQNITSLIPKISTPIIQKGKSTPIKEPTNMVPQKIITTSPLIQKDKLLRQENIPNQPTKNLLQKSPIKNNKDQLQGNLSPYANKID